MRSKWKPKSGDSANSDLATQKLVRATSATFWAWIAYQTIKGLITTTLIWVPLAYYYFFA